MKTKKNYYQIIGKNKHIPVFYYTEAKSSIDAKIHFYLEIGTDADCCIKISKSQYLKNKNI